MKPLNMMLVKAKNLLGKNKIDNNHVLRYAVCSKENLHKFKKEHPVFFRDWMLPIKLFASKSTRLIQMLFSFYNYKNYNVLQHFVVFSFS